MPRQLTDIRERLVKFVKGISRFKRSVATHMFVVMISSELRDKKPYALPIQCLPYAGLKESDIRRIVTNTVKEMVGRGMKVRGFVSNGEFNYLRTKGYTRPLSIFQIRTQVRRKYSHVGRAKLQEMLTPLKKPDGSICALRHNPAISASLLGEIYHWMEQDSVSMDDVANRLRHRTVPSGYPYCTWTPGEKESITVQLRSIIAQFEYTYIVRKWTEEGVPFQYHFYVPESLPETGTVFLEREDEAHVFKRIAMHTRNGGPNKLSLERYVEALSDASSGLTYPALTGQRKQSVIDAERLFSPSLIEFMKKKDYQYEAKYIEVLWNWRRSCDERGLSELNRSKFNHQLLNLILDELMPWHIADYDLSLLEVNRPVSKVLGFSRETLAAVTTNIESREWRRRQVQIKPEHPRSGTSDDVECFFSVMRDTIGRNFTSKQVKYAFRKVCMEFMKRMNEDLPFYYHTSSHTRFQEGQLPDFSEPSCVPKRKNKRLPIREQPAAFAVRRATMPVRGSLAIRPKFHNLPMELPPPPTGPIHICEHSY